MSIIPLHLGQHKGRRSSSSSSSSSLSDAPTGPMVRRLGTRTARLGTAALISSLLFLAYLHAHRSTPSTVDYIPALLGLGPDADDDPELGSWPPETESEEAVPEAPLEFAPEGSSAFYRLYEPAPSRQADTQVRPIAAHELVSNDCLEEWIAGGVWGTECAKVKVDVPRVDLVWTWVNGSDPLHESARIPFLPKGMNGKTVQKQYREHDELRYSLRSALIATKSWKGSQWHLVTNSFDVPPGAGGELDMTGTRLGQVPQWMDLALAEAGNVHFHHDTELFLPIPDPLDGALPEAAIDAWRAEALPTFDSMAVESQLANLPPSEVADHTVFSMDDTFMLGSLPPTVFYSPLHGPVIRLQPDLLVNPLSGSLPNGAGEWRGLQTAATHLSARFGSRGRPYLAHFSRSVPLPLMHEASLMFGGAFSGTATSRFRGEDASRPESHVIWLATHMIVERHREALLWSWAVAKWGGDKEWVSDADKDRMWEELGGTAEMDQLDFSLPYREGKHEVSSYFSKLKLPDPAKGATSYAHLAADGYPYTYLPFRNHPLVPTQAGWADLGAGDPEKRPKGACKLERDVCLGRDGETPSDLLKRIMLDVPQCGDCIITGLMHPSGPRGLSAFLPPRDPSSRISSPPALPSPSYLPLHLDDLLAFPLPSDPRAFVLRVLQRYSYVLGDTRSRFFGITSATNARSHLQRLDRDNKDPAGSVALLCVNDDVSRPEMVRQVEEVLRTWFQQTWPERMRIER